MSKALVLPVPPRCGYRVGFTGYQLGSVLLLRPVILFPKSPPKVPSLGSGRGSH